MMGVERYDGMMMGERVREIKRRLLKVTKGLIEGIDEIEEIEDLCLERREGGDVVAGREGGGYSAE